MEYEERNCHSERVKRVSVGIIPDLTELYGDGVARPTVQRATTIERPIIFEVHWFTAM